MQVRFEATKLLHGYCRNKGVTLDAPSSEWQRILPEAPTAIAAALGLTVTISNAETDGLLRDGVASNGYIGLLHRPKKAIIVAQLNGSAGMAQRRFTIGHEIGHYQLHPDLNPHRDLPVDHEHRERRPIKEQEADLFSAELLMPSELVRAEFSKRFYVNLDGLKQARNLLFWISDKVADLDEDEFLRNRFYRASQIAQVRCFYDEEFIPLNSFFRVSAPAMARQLLDLSLVK